jgi:hypothetical protein
MGQTPANIQFSYTNAFSSTPVSVGSGGTINLGSVPVSSTATATLTISNRDTVQWTISPVTVSGLPFQVTSPGSLSILPGQNQTYQLSFSPSAPGVANGTLSVNLVSGTQTLAPAFSLAGTGLLANLTFSYLLVGSGSQAPLAANGTITFPNTTVGQTSAALLIISNTGNATGTVLGVSLPVGAFRLLGLPPLPAQIAAGAQISFTIQFVPTAQQTAAMPLQIILSAQTIQVNLSGQGVGPSFVYQATVGSSVSPVANNGTVTLAGANVGTSGTATITIQNTGSGSGQVSSITISGTGYSLANVPLLPAAIAPGQALSFTVVFTPSQSGAAQGRLLIDGVSINLAGTGLQANLIFSYILTADGNQILLADNSTINFPGTAVGQSSTATLVVFNAGTAPGTVTGVTLAAGGFKLSGLPLLPAQVAPGQNLQFTVMFVPTTSQSAASQLQIVLGTSTIHVNLSGQGTGPSFVYQANVGSSVTTIASNGTLALPDTNVGSSSTATILIQNMGNGVGQVSSITVSGAGYQLTNLPSLPATVSPGGQGVTFTIVFTPTQSGAAQARLLIDSTTINLTGDGLGSALSLTVTQGSTTAPIAGGGVVIFPNTAVGSQSPAVIQITNTGNVSTNINSIGLSGNAYQLANLPPLPAAVGPGQNLQITVSFAPNGLGSTTGQLQINSLQINLTGVGLAPPTLPAVSFGGLGGSAGPAQQPSLGLALASPYPLAISGTLTLSFAPAAFTDDPAIQFATGGRNVNFTIPANTTQAIFGPVATQVQFQTGTVAGTITITPTFATGTVNLTPAVPAIMTVTIAPSAPQIRSVQIGTRTANSFQVLVTGFSTPRTMTGMNLQFTASPGANLGTSDLNVGVTGAFSTWYQSAASAQFGSQFTAALNIVVAGDITAVQSVAVTATNQSGTSTSASVSLR